MNKSDIKKQEQYNRAMNKIDAQVSNQYMEYQSKTHKSTLIKPKKHITDYIYLDNNGTTSMLPDVIEYMKMWANCGNASASYSEDIGSGELIGNFKAKIAEYAAISLDEYEIIINSGASESNNYIINSTIRAYTKIQRRAPHIIVTSIEHKSLITCAKQCNDETCQVTFVAPEQNGSINIENIKANILPHTALVCCMYANNETGALNNINDLSLYLANRQLPIPLYVDCTQSFGKIRPFAQNIKLVAFSSSFHKFGGPTGIGILAISKNFLTGYKLCAEICGAQNHGLRGGTENLSLIAGAFASLHICAKDRDKKNRNLLSYSIFTLRYLHDKIKAVSYFEDWTEENIRMITGIPDYKKSGRPPKVEMVVIGCKNLIAEERAKRTLPNTVMIAFLNHESPEKYVCNFKIVDYLRAAGIIIGMGSACNTGELSYVLQAMKVPPQIIKGTLRISFGDINKDEDCKILCDNLLFALEHTIRPNDAARRNYQRENMAGADNDTQSVNSARHRSKSRDNGSESGSSTRHRSKSRDGRSDDGVMRHRSKSRDGRSDDGSMRDKSK